MLFHAVSYNIAKMHENVSMQSVKSLLNKWALKHAHAAKVHLVAL